MDEVLSDLDILREFLHGAHLATTDDNAGVVLHLACHKVDAIINYIKINVMRS